MGLKTDPVTAKEAGVITKATIRAAERLAIRSNVLCKIVGVSEATVSRMRKDEYFLEPGDKAFELAVLFVRFYRSLIFIALWMPSLAALIPLLRSGSKIGIAGWTVSLLN
jgi:hypothetical protein